MSTINRELYQALIEAKARLALVEKLQWVIIAGVIGLLVKAYIFGQ